MRFAIAGPAGHLAADGLAAALRDTLLARDNELLEASAATPGPADLILNLTSVRQPRAHYLRPDASVFVASIVESADGDAWPDREALRRISYATLVQTMSNLVIHRVAHGRHGGAAYLVTPELGFRSMPDDASLGDAIVDVLAPLAQARVVMANELAEDLPEALWDGDERSRELMACGRTLADMDLLPAVFDPGDLLDEHDLRILRKVFGIRQLSYGNLSVRRDANSFWMSARGADKGRLESVGVDVLLVTGYDPGRGCMHLSVPPGTDPGVRVSVDAIEHFKIYDALPEVGAVVHVHAWMDGVQATSQAWPCGTEELADEVLQILRGQPDPSRGAVGLKNHGLTLTGRTLDDVFGRIRGRLSQKVPVLA